MGQLIYSMNVSLDGYVADCTGNLDWGVPDSEVMEAINADLAEVGTYLYGRKVYEVMQVWETDPKFAQRSPQDQEFARIWQAAQKRVYSTKLQAVVTDRTQLHSNFDPAEVTALKEESDRSLTVNGPTLAGAALRYGLIDEVHLLIHPVALGCGLSFWPAMKIELTLQSERRFASGVLQLKYAVRAH